MVVKTGQQIYTAKEGPEGAGHTGIPRGGGRPPQRHNSGHYLNIVMIMHVSMHGKG